MPGDPSKYDYLRYNHHNVLRITFIVWAIGLFLSRDLLFLFMVGVSKGRSGNNPAPPAQDVIPDLTLVFAAIPAVIVLIAAGARLPRSGTAARFVWRWGREFLLASVILYFVILGWTNGPDIAAIGPITWGFVVINLLIAAYLLSSSYIKDLFAEFPSAPDTSDN